MSVKTPATRSLPYTSVSTRPYYIHEYLYVYGCGIDAKMKRVLHGLSNTPTAGERNGVNRTHSIPGQNSQRMCDTGNNNETCLVKTGWSRDLSSSVK